MKGLSPFVLWRDERESHVGGISTRCCCGLTFITAYSVYIRQATTLNENGLKQFCFRPEQLSGFEFCQFENQIGCFTTIN